MPLIMAPHNLRQINFTLFCRFCRQFTKRWRGSHTLCIHEQPPSLDILLDRARRRDCNTVFWEDFDGIPCPCWRSCAVNLVFKVKPESEIVCAELDLLGYHRYQSTLWIPKVSKIQGSPWHVHTSYLFKYFLQKLYKY